MHKLTKILAAFAILMCGLAATLDANAVPIGPGNDSGTIETTIYGDARDGNPGDLGVDVTIDWQLNADGTLTATWTVAISDETLADYAGNPLRIHAFGFNLNHDGDVFVSTNGDWDVATQENIPGTGNTMIEFLLCSDSNGPGLQCTGDTESSLQFTMQLDCSQIACDTDMFFGADEFTGDYIPGDGIGQMGAHIIGFNDDCSGAVGGMFDSSLNTPGDGFGDGESECRSVTVPEPGSLSLLGLGLLGIALARRRRDRVRVRA